MINRFKVLAGLIKESHNSFLKDIYDQTYIGLEINEKDISKYIQNLKNYLGADYENYYSFKEQRDGEKYHLTIVSPIEYRKLEKMGINIPPFEGGKPNFLGIGKAEKDEKSAYYIIVDYPDGNRFRDMLGLEPKDFHITLGFVVGDVHGVGKGINTKII